MNSIINPFSPGAGSPPPELVGREGILIKAEVLLGRVRQGRPEKSLLLTGLRGVGKTVLLNEIERKAQKEEYRTLLIEAHDAKPLAYLLAPQLRQLLYELNRMAGAGHAARRGLSILKAFVGSVKVSVGEIELGIDLEPEKGTADTGDIENDLPQLLSAIAEAAQERKTAIAILIDEIQYLNQAELSGLIMAMHKMQQKQLPLVLIGAGLPILPALAGESKSYAERLFEFPAIGALQPEDAKKAVHDPIVAAGEQIEKEALDEIANQTQGYPYFIQEWGYQIWNYATQSPITLNDVRHATTRVIERLDANFFRVRFDRLTPSEKRYLRAMAELGSGPYRSSDVADKLGHAVHALGPTRSKLIKKGMIYSPAYGDVAFTVPLFDLFMRRQMTSIG